MVLIDTNVLAVLVLDGPSTTAARALLDQDDDWRSEDYVLIELSNVLATTMRVRELPLAKAQEVFLKAKALIEPGLISVDHADVIAMAHRYHVSAYDGRFLVAAHEMGTKLITEDAKLRRAAPKLTQSIAEALDA